MLNTRRPPDQLLIDRLQRISELEMLIEVAPPLPELRLSWHYAIEKFLDGTRDG
jgi:hypothetical protein